MTRLATQTAESILGAIEGVNISTGIAGLTVLLRTDPVVTVTPVAGQYLVRTVKSLEARPRKSDHVAHQRASVKDPDWEAFLTPRINDVRLAMRLAAPRLRWRAETASRIEAELLGTVEALDTDGTDPLFWSRLAAWAEVSGAMPRSRNIAKWARIYGRQLGAGRPVSERFAAWAQRVEDEATAAGFRPVRTKPGVGEHAEPRGGGPRGRIQEDADLLFEALVVWRSERANRDAVSEYAVMPDETLRAIALAKPHSIAALRRVRGMGPKKLEDYGDEVVALVEQASWW